MTDDSRFTITVNRKKLEVKIVAEANQQSGYEIYQDGKHILTIASDIIGDNSSWRLTESKMSMEPHHDYIQLIGDQIEGYFQ
jgi:hypothetical protein